MGLVHSFNIFDVFVLVVISFSAFLGFFRGFAKETLSLIAWLGSGVASWKYHHFVYPLWKKWIVSPSILKLVCYLSVFLSVLIVSLCVVQWMALKVQASLVRSVDSSLGIVFGVGRGVIFVLGVYTASLFFIAPDQQPEIVRISYSEAWLNQGVLLCEKCVPETIKNTTFVQSVKLILQNFKEATALTETLALPDMQMAETPER